MKICEVSRRQVEYSQKFVYPVSSRIIFKDTEQDQLPIVQLNTEQVQINTEQVQMNTEQVQLNTEHVWLII